MRSAVAARFLTLRVLTDKTFPPLTRLSEQSPSQEANSGPLGKREKSGPISAKAVFVGILSDERSGLTLGELPANVPLTDYGRLAVIRPESRAQKVFAQTTAAFTANPQVKLIGMIYRCRLNI